MVEGPQCALKTQALKILQEQRLVAVTGCPNCVHDGTVGSDVLRVFNVGKECFIVFAARAIRLHFAMAGNMEITQTHETPSAITGRRRHTATLLFSLHRIVLWDSSCTQVTLGYVDRWSARAARDIIADSFDMDEVLRLLAACGDQPVADAIMDQQISPGVGNVIKCEGLVSAAINPAALCFELSHEQLYQLVRSLRDFALYWYNCCSKRKSANKQIYGREACVRCDGRVTLVRLQATSRITYFCAHCQPIMTSADTVSRVLNGWQPITKPRKRDTTAHTLHECWQKPKPLSALNQQASNVAACWDCTRCTYRNKGSTQRCSMCDFDKPATTPSMSPLPAEVVARISQSRAAAQARLLSKRKRPNHENEQVHIQTVKDEKGEHSSTLDAVAQHTCDCTLKSGSKAKAALHRVRKDGLNRGRLFWSCHKKTNGCGLFLWADAQFPKCKCEQRKVTVLRTVLKPGVNNGRLFYACSADKATQCGLFEWADIELGTRIPL